MSCLHKYAKTEVRTRMWFTCNIHQGQGHDSKPHMPRAVQKPYITQETSAKYLLNKINMYPMLIPLNSWTRGRLIKTQELAEKGPLGVNSNQLSETTNMRNYPHSNSDSLPLRAVTQTAILDTDSYGA